MSVSLEEARNARLPEELWQIIFVELGAEGYPLALDEELIDHDSSLPSLLQTCKALWHWCRSWLWTSVHIRDIGYLKDLIRRLKCSPGALDHIKNLKFTLHWEWYSDYHYDWEICGPPEEWYFEDRAPKKKEYLLRHVIPEDEKDEVDTWNEHDWDAIYDGKYIYGWNQGYRGEGEDSLVKSASHFRSLVTPLIEGMKNLQTFHWGTNIIPLNARICGALAKAEHLQEVSLGPCGQFYTSSFSQSPLWLIFEGRANKPLPCLYLNLEMFPSSRQFQEAKDVLGECHNESLLGLADCYQEGRGLVEIPDPDRYLQYTYLDDAPEPELSFVERPLAMLYRTMMASRGRLRHVQTTELALARVKAFLPLWAQTALKGFNNTKKRQDYREDNFLRAVADLQPALSSLVTPDYAQPSEESLLRVFNSEKTLQLLLPCIQGDEKLQADLWDAFVEGKRNSLPDWTRPSLQNDTKLRRHLSMVKESYIRDVPQG